MNEQVPGVPPWLVGIIMSSYYGGRSEVHLRRLLCRVAYCDFLSMYPTVSILMGLWRYVIAQGITWREATAETRALVADIEVADLARPETWRALPVLVQVEAADDVFPARAPYERRGAAYSIALNHLSCNDPLWFTLADVIVSKLRTGRMPKIRRALAFSPLEPQEGLKPIDLLGNPTYRVDPTGEDLYLRLIALRSEIKHRMRSLPPGPERERLDAEQHRLKIIANATCYGIFVELNVIEYARKRKVTYCGFDAVPHTAKLAGIEEPGRFFHPLLATLTTGAARLMLALAESHGEAEGLGWAFCDTDSWALACPPGMPEAEFTERAGRVRGWFEQLNPYSSGDELFKLEDYNFAIDAPETVEPLYCWAVSDKRYALFNRDGNGRPVLRKASAHGLGYLMAPYPPEQAPTCIPAPRVPLIEIGVERWEYDLWYRIVEAALDGHPEQVDFAGLPGFEEVALSRYAATRPHLMHWFDTYNEGRPYTDKVRPFGFLNAYQVKSPAQRDPRTLPLRTDPKGKRESMATWEPKVVSPFDPDPAVAVTRCFDRETGEPVPAELLKTYQQAVAQYHLHPESKFIGGNYTDSGVLRRRHVQVPATDGIEQIGKEANHWEERSQTGDDPASQIKYGRSGGSRDELRDRVACACEAHGVRAVARAADLAHSVVLRFLKDGGQPDADTVRKIQGGLTTLAADETRERAVLEWAREEGGMIGLRQLADTAGVDRANLRAVFAGRRKVSPVMLAKLEAARVRYATNA
jgi:hypothetical protein